MNIKKVCLILSQEKYVENFGPLMEKLSAEGVVCDVPAVVEEAKKEEGVLYITDLSSVLKKLMTQGIPVLAYLHEGNRGQDFSTAKYACEQPQELEAEYLERVYRRFAGLPWNILETDRCILRESVEEDVEAFFMLYSDPAITRYMDDLYENRISEQAYIREYIDKMYSYYEFGIWTVILKETGEIIGRAGLSVREGYELPELGYMIGVLWQGRGLAKEVCQGILKYAREEFGFDKIQALVRKENEASIRLIKCLGFKKMDEIRKKDVKNDFFVLNNEKI